jgi:uncharacterized phage-like protein YoqJ
MPEIKTLAFTGSRPHKLPWGFDESHPACLSLKTTVKERLVRLIEDKNVRRFISGMAMGIDMICAEIVLELKESYPDINLTAAVPCKDQDMLWPQKQRDRYTLILGQCDDIHMISEAYSGDCMEKRNKWMADHCDMLLAVWNEKPGGAGKTLKYAEKRGIEIVIIDPSELSDD